MPREISYVNPHQLKEAFKKIEFPVIKSGGFPGLRTERELLLAERSAIAACLTQYYLGGQIVRVGMRTPIDNSLKGGATSEKKPLTYKQKFEPKKMSAAYYFNILPNGDKFDLMGTAMTPDTEFLMSGENPAALAIRKAAPAHILSYQQLMAADNMLLVHGTRQYFEGMGDTRIPHKFYENDQGMNASRSLGTFKATAEFLLDLKNRDTGERIGPAYDILKEALDKELGITGWRSILHPIKPAGELPTHGRSQ